MKLKSILATLCLAVLTACAGAETPEQKLAVSEVSFQGLQTTIIRLAEQGVINQNNAACVDKANQAVKSALNNARNAVKLKLQTAATVVGSANAAMASLSTVITALERGEKQPCL